MEESIMRDILYKENATKYVVHKLRLDLSINTIDNESQQKYIIVHELYRPPCGKIKSFKNYFKKYIPRV